VDVLNGTGEDGVAARNASALQNAGFKIAVVDTAPSPSTKTVVEYPSGMQSQAAAVAAHVPGAATAQGSVAVVTLLLGSDGLQATGAAPTSAATPTLPSSPTSRTAAQAGCIY
jgi:hypothetical protein